MKHQTGWYRRLWPLITRAFFICPMPYNASKHEKEILEFWEKDKTFEKSVNERPEDKPYVFYDGPPFATGLPHYGHIVASVMKDVVPRYQTMNGKRVERVWGWDCHGLPIENIVEKELGTKSKQEVEVLGVDKFNEMCRSKVLSYVGEWERTVNRLGRWIDMKNAYRTMDIEFMESVWWVFKQLWEKDLIYKGHKAMHICPRCETTLSQQEVSEGYKDIKDLSVTAQFKLTNAKEQLDLDGDVYMLAWTTTPWTLPGNVLLAVGETIEYALVKYEDAHFLVAKDLVMANFEGKEFEVVGHHKGKDLVGLTYEPLFPYFADSENAFRVIVADFVTTEDGTGVVHIAPGFGTDDYEVFKKEGVPFIQHVGMNGRFIDAVTDFAGMHVKPQEDHMATDVQIIKWLAHNGKLFSKKKYEHSYPHCWRCDTPLLNYATTSWFVAVTKVKDDALKQAKNINWSPPHIKEGRFGKWLEGARDWSISRQRFWASVIPVWVSDDGQDEICVGSVAELEELSGVKVDDLHKHVVDHITFEKNGKTYTRVPDVLDTWFDSGSMPYAQVHYPFENEQKFEAGFPAEYIAEGQDQTRAWFYYLHVLGIALKGTHAFNNVIVNGIVLAEDGKKMSKKLQNYPDPNKVLEEYGADALRFYLMSSPIVAAESLNFSEEGVREVFNKVVNTLANVLSFYEMFSDSELETRNLKPSSKHVLDRWILAKLQELIGTVTNHMEGYRLDDAARPMMDFILDLSQWYVRRSRDRMKGSNAADQKAAVVTLGYVLRQLSLVMAPFTPFIAEKVWYAVTGEKESVHLQQWPKVEKKMVDEKVIEDMVQVRKVVEMGMSLRKEAGIRVRQPLGTLMIAGADVTDDLLEIIAQELNVKKAAVETKHASSPSDVIVSKTDNQLSVALNTEITDELRKEGLQRELVRAINGLRKDQGLTREDRITVQYQTDSDLLKEVIDMYKNELQESVLADAIAEGKAEHNLDLSGESISLSLSKA